MFDLLLIFVFVFHLAAVNIAAAGPFLCIALEWRATRRNDDFAGKIGRRLAVLSVLALIIGVAIGAVLLLMLSSASPSYRSAIGRVPAHRWWFAAGEIVFYLACMIPYALLWDRAVSQRWWHRLLAVLAATDLLYHFPPLFTMISLLSARSELANATLDRSLYLTLFTDGETLSRVAHHWLASLATAGIAQLVLAAHTQVTADGPHSNWASAAGARIGLAATVLQLPVGLCVLLASPATVQTQLVGGEPKGTLLFGGAIVAVVLLLQQLLSASFGDTRRRTALVSAILFFVVLLLMSGVLHRVRASTARGEPPQERLTRASEVLR